MRAGVFGGTFDPIHLGHLTVAREVSLELDLDELLFVPAGQPWLKADRHITPVVHRVKMISLAISGSPGFKLSTIEADRPGPSYSIDTIDALRHQMGNDANIFLIVGSDALADLPKWKEPQRLIQECQLATYSRAGTPVPSLKTLEAAIPGISRHIRFVEVSPMDVSSTLIRRKIALGETLAGMVPESVEQYILKHGLYK